MVTLHDKRRRTFDNKALYAARDPLQSVLRQRFFAVEDGQGRNIPVDTFRSGTPWHQPAALHLQRLRIPMGNSRPLDWATIATHNHEEAFADRRRAVITRA